MPTFRKSPPELVARFAELAELVPTATRKQMFGYPTCVLGGNMFMGLHDDRLLVVPPAMLDDEPTLAEWIARSFAYAGQLPPKKPKTPARF